MSDQYTTHQIKPCPFCGGCEIFIEPDERGSGGQWVPPVHVGCSHCAAEQRGDNTELAIVEWNRRVYSDAQASETDLLRKTLDDMAAGIPARDAEIVALRAERDKLRETLKTALTWSDYDTEYDGRMYQICQSCGGQDGDHIVVTVSRYAALSQGEPE